METREQRLVVGFGSNLGDRRATLISARSELGAFGTVVKSSALYETPPLGPPQPAYLNAAVLFESALTPEALLDALLAIEQRAGRARRERWGPRTLDLDILWGDGWTSRTARLVVPHPELARRAFALRPLLDVAPSATDLESGVRYADLLGSVDSSEIRELFGTREQWESGGQA